MKDSLEPGIRHTLVYPVPPERTVPHILPEAPEFAGLPAVFATAYLVAVVEWAAVRALEPHLDEGEASLGVHIDLSHDSPTVPGMTVTVETEITAVTGRIVEFRVRARDDNAVVGEGTHRRAVIDRGRFQAKVDALTERVHAGDVASQP